jgi:pimeloyl-ACP methyl ester carboxylesterase
VRDSNYEERVLGEEKRAGGVRVQDITFRNLQGGRTAAYLVLPPGHKKNAAALYVHWYESEAKNSNRTQFLEEAVELAGHGLLSLLVETPWSDSQWYAKRDVSKDFENSVQEVKELRRALSFLLVMHEGRIDGRRVALVGHDFGAMYGLLAASADRRVSALALQAFTGSFSDWFLYNQRALSPEAKQAVVDRLAPLDPLRYVPQLGTAPVLMQFAKEDFYVPREKAEALYAAARGPKKILWYDAGHGLNPQASLDRMEWLRAMLKLK